MNYHRGMTVLAMAIALVAFGSTAGRAEAWTMNTDLGTADATFLAETAGDRAGEAVAAAGDVNGDGYDDMLIGAWSNDEGDTSAGEVYLFFGSPAGFGIDTGLQDADASFVGEGYYDCAGRAVAGAGDVNGDGFDDILIGAAGNDDIGLSAGKAYLWYGVAPCFDHDADGYLPLHCGGLDCDDNDAATYPGAPELYDAADNDCDDLYDEGVLPPEAVIVTEVMFQPQAVPDLLGEWFEVSNDAALDVNLVGKQFGDLAGDAFTVSGDLWIEAGGQVVLGPEDDVGSWCGTRLQNPYRLAGGDYGTPGETNDDCTAAYGDVLLRVIEPQDTVRAPGEEVGPGRARVRSRCGADLSLTLTGRLFRIGGGPNYVPVTFTGVTVAVGESTARPIVFTTPPGFPQGDYQMRVTATDEASGALLAVDSFLVRLALPEVCNWMDDDGDGMIDEGFDEDGDNWSTCEGDCDDTDANVHPWAIDVCDDGIDQDCDGVDAICP